MELLRFGISFEYQKKYWRLAKTEQAKALSLAYWQEQGLIKLVERNHELLQAS